MVDRRNLFGHNPHQQDNTHTPAWDLVIMLILHTASQMAVKMSLHLCSAGNNDRPADTFRPSQLRPLPAPISPNFVETKNNSDIFVGRLVVWDPLNCNHGPGPSAITEEPLCRAHDTDGCRFCHESCENFRVRYHACIRVNKTNVKSFFFCRPT